MQARYRGMISPLISKLEHGCVLHADDSAKLRTLAVSSRLVPRHEDIISEGDPPGAVNLVLKGVACRYKMLAGGRRQIMALLLPGDFCDLHVAILGEMDHSIGAITACSIAEFSREVVHDLTDNHPRISRALWWATLVDEAILREWLVCRGGRSAEQQLAHLFCELLIRMQLTGHADATSFAFPLTQEDLADTLGLSVVHVNRSLQKLRADQLIRLHAQRLTVLDLPALERLAEYNPNYLHLRQGLRPPVERSGSASSVSP